MKAKVKRISIPKNKRIVAISDIHGNLNLFKRLLEKVCYTENDILIILGDLIEKGDMSLKTLRYIMELIKKNQIYVISGNCDTIWEDIKGEIDDEYLLKYMISRKNSILKEMCEELSIEISENSDIKHIKEEIKKNFSYELNWLEELPHIIETEDFIFAHAGITSENLENQDANKVMKNDAFMEQGLSFSKYIVVGHWPTVNYGKSKGCCNPIINKEQKIISIDGGNVIKDDGQLNALIINDKENITFDSVDNFSMGEIIENQEESSNSIQISWIDNAVEVLEEREEFSLCRHISSNHELWIKNNRLFKVKGGTYCYDCTDYFLPVSKGDRVSIVEKSKNQSLVKKDGTIGWVLNKKIKEEKVVNIRLATIDDEEKISRLIAEFRVELNGFKQIKSTPNIEHGREEFKEYMEDKYPIFVSEEDNKELSGYLVCKVDGGTVWVESLFVSHDARRRGIASKLFDKAEELAKDFGGDTVYNYVHPNNHKIISFLSKKGYNVLNLIEIRKAWQNEVLTQKINVGDHEYNY